MHASAFSLRNILQFETAYLGAYADGLGVTDRGEGNGSNNRDRVDNIGDRHDIVLLEFNQKVVPDRVFLDDVGADSDILIIIGNANDPYNHHLTMNGAMLTDAEINDGGNASRWAGINTAQKAGNWMLIMPRLLHSNDEFKIRRLEFKCPQAKHAAAPALRPVRDADGRQYKVALEARDPAKQHGETDTLLLIGLRDGHAALDFNIEWFSKWSVLEQRKTSL